MLTVAAFADADLAAVRAQTGLSDLAARCVLARAGLTPANWAKFLQPRLADLRAPDGLTGLDVAVDRLRLALARQERIGVFGDYDVDGVTSAAVMTGYLRALGATVEAAVARRDAGYGFAESVAQDFVARGCSLVVICDCGTQDLAALTWARAHGLEAIVLDHHTVPSHADLATHPAVALVNPFRADSTFAFRGLASVGLAFYAISRLRSSLRQAGIPGPGGGELPDPRAWLDLVALGSVADMVPLVDENRVLTSHGLERLNLRLRPGLRALLARAEVGADQAIDAKTISFRIAPRLNAPGRLSEALPALRLLLATEVDAEAIADELELLNGQRRQEQDRITAEAEPMVAQALAESRHDAVMVIAGQGWAPGVVGVVAARLVEQVGRPTFVIALDPTTGIGRGSARTPAGVNLVAALGAAAPFLERFGGHAAAAGLTVHPGQVDALREALHDAVCAQRAAGSGPVTTRIADAETPLAAIRGELVDELERLAPFGQANPPPLLLTRGAAVRVARRVGDGSHLRLELDLEESGGRSMGAIGFGLGNKPVSAGTRVDIAYRPVQTTWQGTRRVELEVVDVMPVADPVA